DGDTTGLLFRRLVDLVERREGGRRVGVVQDLGDGRSQRRLAVVDVAHRADVDVGLVPLELLLRHGVGGTPSLAAGLPPPNRYALLELAGPAGRFRMQLVARRRDR